MAKFLSGQEVVPTKSFKHIRSGGSFTVEEGTPLIIVGWNSHLQHYVVLLKNPKTPEETNLTFPYEAIHLRPVNSEPIDEDSRTREELLEDIQEISEIIGSFYTEGEEGAKSLSPKLFSHAPQIALVSMLANGMSRKKAKRLYDKLNNTGE